MDKAQLQWRLEEVRVIRYGTVQRLVEALASDTGDLDSSYVNAFLETYRTFATVSDVMSHLLNWFVTFFIYSYLNFLNIFFWCFSTCLVSGMNTTSVKILLSQLQIINILETCKGPTMKPNKCGKWSLNLSCICHFLKAANL